MPLSKVDIYKILRDRLGDAAYILIVLKDGPLLKEQIWKKVNEYYKEKHNTDKELIYSRYVLDILTARLEGAGLVNVKKIGRARMYSRSEIADELTEYSKQISIKK